MNIKTDDIVVAQYSQKRESFNVCVLSDAISNNREDAVKRMDGDYVIIGAFASYDEAEAACEKFQLTLDSCEDEFIADYLKHADDAADYHGMDSGSNETEIEDLLRELRYE